MRIVSPSSSTSSAVLQQALSEARSAAARIIGHQPAPQFEARLLASAPRQRERHSAASSYRAKIDDAGEREGAAIETLAGLTEEPAPESQRQVLLGQARAAEALGIQQERLPHHCRHAAVIAWLRICDGDPTYKFTLNNFLDNDIDRLRRAARRLRRTRRLAKLKHAEPSRVVSLSEAAKLVDLSERTLQKHCASGLLAAQLHHGKGRPAFLVRIHDLRQLLARKLGRAIAA